MSGDVAAYRATVAMRSSVTEVVLEVTLSLPVIMLYPLLFTLGKLSNGSH